MDAILTEFIQRTKADPALAQDLLDATLWDLEAAIAAFEGFNITCESQQHEEGECAATLMHASRYWTMLGNL